MKAALIAMVCHTVNAAFCRAIGDDTQPAWADATEDIKASAIVGVEYKLANPGITPEQQHAAWMEHKAAQGWTLGEVKDAEKKTHPSMVPWDQLPGEQRVKDFLFQAVVDACKDIPDAAAPAVTASAAPVGQARSLAVKYVGRRPTYTDGTFGTRITFEQGETKMVPAEVAVKMFGHPDVYVPGDAPPVLATPEDAASAQKAKEDADRNRAQEDLEIARDGVRRMTTKRALADFASQNFNVTIDDKKKVDELKTEVLVLIDRFGLPS